MNLIIAKTLILAIAYYALGSLSLLLAIPPGFATPVWPAAGVALVGILIWGYRCLPGVFLGSFSVNLLIAYNAGANIGSAVPLLVASSIAGGAVVQTAFSVYLIKRVVTIPTRLEQDIDIFNIVLRGGFIGCLINATWGTLTLFSAGIITANQFAFNWFTWWIGDAIGTILVAPLILILSSKGVSKTRRVSVTTPIIFMFAVVVVLFYFSRENGQQSNKSVFSETVTHQAHIFHDRILIFQEVLTAVKRLYISSDHVSAKEFRTFISDNFKKYPDIAEFQWIPRISLSDRKKFEEQIRKQVNPKFKIWSGSKKTKTPVSNRPFYYPVLYSESPAKSDVDLGYDLGSELEALKKLISSRKTGQLTVLPPNIIETDTLTPLIAPVYANGNALEGFVLIKIRMKHLVKNSSETASGNISKLHIYSQTSDGKTITFFGEPPKSPAYSHRIPVQVGDMTWQLEFTPNASYSKQNKGWQTWLVLTGGLLFTSLLQAFLLSLTARTDVVRKLVETKTTELRQSEEQFRSAMEYSAIGMALVSFDGSWLKVNQALCDILGYSEKELLNTHFSLVTHPDDVSDDLQQVQQLIDGKINTYQKEKRYVHKEGHIVIALVNVSSIKNNNKKTGYFISQIQDITERKKHETEMQELSERLTHILDNAGEGVYGLDLYGYTTFANKAAQELVGYTVDEMQEVPQHTLIHHHYADGSPYPREKCNIYASFKEGKTTTEDSEVFWRKDGTSIPVEYTSAPMRNKDGSISGAVVVFRDISERKKTEEEILRSNLELERFAYIASHDLQEPLRMISTFTNLIQDEYQEHFDEKANKYLEFVTNASDRMQALVKDLLEYSRAGQSVPNFEKINCNTLVESVIEALSEIIDETGAKVTFGQMPEINSNAIRISRLLQNLVGNGIKYQKPGAKPIIHIEAQERTNEWVFSVKDNGIGIKADYLEQVFILFKRLHNKEEYSGTGIGLAICKKIVESIGGKIWVESVYGEGSTFYFSIPGNNLDDVEAA